MNDPYLDPPASPSWAFPIALGIGLVLVLQLVNTAMLLVGLPPCCCCGGEGLLLGTVPAFVARDRDQNMTLVHGFTVSFIGIGLGGVMIALLSVVQNDAETRREMEENLRQFWTDLAEQTPDVSPEQVDGLVEGTMAVAPYAPLVYAALLALFGGLGGMLGYAFARRRNDPDPEAPVS